MKMFPRLAIVILFTLLSIQQTRSNCCPQLAKAVHALKSVFQKTQERITYKEYEYYPDIPYKKISEEGHRTKNILVGEFYPNGIGIFGSRDDLATCTQIETPEQWPSNYLPSVRFTESISSLDVLRERKTMNKEDLEKYFDYQKEIWKCETQGKNFNMVVNRLKNKHRTLAVAEVKYLNGVEVDKNKIDHEWVAKIKEVKYSNPETHVLVKYVGWAKMMESEPDTKNP